MERLTEFRSFRSRLFGLRPTQGPVLLCCLAAGLVWASEARAQMQFNVSSYNQISLSSDGSTVYGTSSFIDNSVGCGHSGYATTATLITPDSTRFSGGGYLYGNTTAPYDTSGTYTELGQLSFHCSCVGTVGSGGDSQCVAHLKLEGGRPQNRHPNPKKEQDVATSASRTEQQNPQRLRPTAVVVSGLLAVAIPGAGKRIPVVQPATAAAGR